jgi:hypothetical protein
MYGDRFWSVDEIEWALLHEVDGRRTLAEVVAAVGLIGSASGRVRRLAECGILDLVPPSRVTPTWTSRADSSLTGGFACLEQLRLSDR